MEDDARRRQGAFFTPPAWAAEAHKQLASSLGSSWQDQYFVWDPAAGTGNLTHSVNLPNLMSSTLEPSDVGMMKDRGCKGILFQYDFLNPGASNLPPVAEDALRAAARQGKRLLFFMNPPYGAGSAGMGEASRAGMTRTLVADQMRGFGLGKAAGQLFCQFVFQADVLAKRYGFENYVVAFFSATTFLTSISFAPFREFWYSKFNYRDGFVFQASAFSGVSGAWAICFTVWEAGGSTPPIGSGPTLRILEQGPEGEIRTVGRKCFFAPTSSTSASNWARPLASPKNKVSLPALTSGLRVKPGETKSVPENFLAYLVNNSNAMYDSASMCTWGSLPMTPSGFAVLPENWRRAVALFAARKLVGVTWWTGKDEYCAPQESSPGYEQWVDDCHAYVLLHHTNCTAAMRSRPDALRVSNPWFWRTRSSLRTLSSNLVGDLLADMEAEPPCLKIQEAPFGEPYFAHLLAQGKVRLSSDAAAVLGLLDNCWLQSLPLRSDFDQHRRATGEQDLHLAAWDAGTYQLRHLFRKHFPNAWAEVLAAHGALARRLADGVYHYGFLV